MALPPSASTITTSSEAFKHPLPSVRQFHKQLNAALEEKNARLRTLVGGSYRQLLGTAEMIVDMRRDITVVEDRLSRVAEGCGRSVVGKRVAGLGKLGVGREVKDLDLSWAARMKVLGGCVVVVGRLLRPKHGTKDGDMSKSECLVLAAKVMVLSRLLVKSLGDEGKSIDDKREALLEEMKRKLGSLRRRLLKGIERMLERVDRERNDLMKALCAYSLGTSSGANYVLRHFLHVRGEAIAMAFEEEHDVPHAKGKMEAVLRAMDLYTKTLLDVQAMTPRSLSEALLGLKAKPLLKDNAIRNLEGLSLDVCEKWFGDEIIFFTPYIKHNDLDGTQAVATLREWANKATEVVLHGLEKTLDRIPEFKTAVELRTKVFETWIRDGGKARGFDSSIMLDGLRDVVNRRLVVVLEARVEKLHLVGSEVEATLRSWPSVRNEQRSNLWSEDLLDMELSHGASEFKQAILSYVHGRNDAVSRVAESFKNWQRLIDDMVVAIEETKQERWNDDLDSLEDDLSLENWNSLLSKDDPAMLQDCLDRGLEKAFQALHEKLSYLSTTWNDSVHAGGITIFMLRILRDLRAALPKRPDLSSFGLSLIPNLHNTLASNVSSGPLRDFSKALAPGKSVAGRALWEGSPELPIYPSPVTFKFLYAMTSSMAIAGSDLWSPAAVRILKTNLRAVLAEQFINSLPSGDGDAASEVNGHEEAKPEEADESAAAPPGGAKQDDPTAGAPSGATSDMTISDDILVQSLFDILILQRCLSGASSSSSADELSGLQDSMMTRTKLEGPSLERLQHTADDYWKRTSLLFGLLA